MGGGSEEEKEYLVHIYGARLACRSTCCPSRLTTAVFLFFVLLSTTAATLLCYCLLMREICGWCKVINYCDNNNNKSVKVKQCRGVKISCVNHMYAGRKKTTN